MLVTEKNKKETTEEIISKKKSRESKIVRFLKTVGISILPFLFVIGIWEVIIVFSNFPEFILPTPYSVFQSLSNFGRWRWLEQILVTGIEVLGGYFLAVVFGILIGILVGWSKFTSRFLMPLLITFNSLPKIAMAPLFLIWFGYGIIPNMWISFFISFFPIAVNTATGILEIEPEMVELGKLFKASKLKIYFRIRIPHSLPYIFAGMKVATTLAVIGAIIGEFIASTRGLAALIMQAQTTLETAAIIGSLLWIGAIGLGLFGLVTLLQKWLTPWAESGKGKAT